MTWEPRILRHKFPTAHPAWIPHQLGHCTLYCLVCPCCSSMLSICSRGNNCLKTWFVICCVRLVFWANHLCSVVADVLPLYQFQFHNTPFSHVSMSFFLAINIQPLSSKLQNHNRHHFHQTFMLHHSCADLCVQTSCVCAKYVLYRCAETRHVDQFWRTILQRAPRHGQRNVPCGLGSTTVACQVTKHDSLMLRAAVNIFMQL